MTWRVLDHGNGFHRRDHWTHNPSCPCRRSMSAFLHLELPMEFENLAHQAVHSSVHITFRLLIRIGIEPDASIIYPNAKMFARHTHNYLRSPSPLHHLRTHCLHQLVKLMIYKRTLKRSWILYAIQFATIRRVHDSRNIRYLKSFIRQTKKNEIVVWPVVVRSQHLPIWHVTKRNAPWQILRWYRFLN